MMDPILEPSRSWFEEDASAGSPNAFISNLTGDWIKPEEATSPEYWAQHLRDTVQFCGGSEPC